MQNVGVTNKEHYGMFWYFLEWSIVPIRKFSNLIGFQQPYKIAYRKWFHKRPARL